MAGRRFALSVADVPALMFLWDSEANVVDPASIGARSSQLRFWKCPVAPDHTWDAGPSAISRALEKGFTGCPCCAGRQLSETNSFAGRHPEGVYLWDTVRNRNLTPDTVLAGSPQMVWWRCPAGPDHAWQAAPLVIGRQALSRGNTGCPYCSGRRASVTNSLARHPDLAREWHPTANGDQRPEDTVAGSARKAWWQCARNPAHQWQASIVNRLRGRGCPHCKASLRSVLEVGVAYELQQFFPDLDLANDKVVIDNTIVHVDLLLPEHRVIIEIDGRYHHVSERAHARDRSKTQQLTAAGYRVLRVREHPLTPLTHSDVVIPTAATIKQTTDAVLNRVRELGWADPAGVETYLTEPVPRRQAEAVALVQAGRPGRKVRVPGPATFHRDERWTGALAMLRAYVDREGHANVPFEHIEDGFKLGAWVGTKRAQYRNGRMKPERQELLTALPGWSWDAIEDAWEVGYRALLNYVGEQGHTGVTATFKTIDGFPLGSWVRSHRRPDGGRRTITPEQRRRLEAVPGWTYDLPNDTAWRDACAALEKFARREGHCRTPRAHREDGISLDTWSRQQRARYHQGDLPPDRVRLLTALPGWSWTPQDDAWEAGFAALLEHIATTGATTIQSEKADHAYPLRAWVGEQRDRYRRGDLADARARRLDTLPGWTWDPQAESWHRHFAALMRFVAREGHARVPTGHTEDNLPLSSWVIRHRQDHKTGRVPADRVRRLEALPGWTWNVLDARWQENYEQLIGFVDREGHARVPAGHVEAGFRLGAWVITQRQADRTSKLSAERTELLEALPGWVWAIR